MHLKEEILSALTGIVHNSAPELIDNSKLYFHLQLQTRPPVNVEGNLNKKLLNLFPFPFFNPSVMRSPDFAVML